jgi:hypothetical protein
LEYATKAADVLKAFGKIEESRHYAELAEKLRRESGQATDKH